MTLRVFDCEEATYTLGTSEPVACKDGDVVSIDASGFGESVTLTVEGRDAAGNRYSNKAVYTKIEDKGETRVYLDTALYPQWSAPYVYLWANGVNEYAPWPGIAMTDEGDGIYSCVLPTELDGYSMNVIFSDNGANQHPDVNIQPGACMLLNAEGKWLPYQEPAPTEPESVSTETTTPDVPTEETETTQQPETKTTGTTLIIAIAAVLAVCAFVVIVIYKRKKHKSKLFEKRPLLRL